MDPYHLPIVYAAAIFTLGGCLFFKWKRAPTRILQQFSLIGTVKSYLLFVGMLGVNIAFDMPYNFFFAFLMLIVLIASGFDGQRNKELVSQELIRIRNKNPENPKKWRKKPKSYTKEFWFWVFVSAFICGLLIVLSAVRIERILQGFDEYLIASVILLFLILWQLLFFPACIMSFYAPGNENSSGVKEKSWDENVTPNDIELLCEKIENYRDGKKQGKWSTFFLYALPLFALYMLFICSPFCFDIIGRFQFRSGRYSGDYEKRFDALEVVPVRFPESPIVLNMGCRTYSDLLTILLPLGFAPAGFCNGRRIPVFVVRIRFRASAVPRSQADRKHGTANSLGSKRRGTGSIIVRF